jgi:hypothetical protein
MLGQLTLAGQGLLILDIVKLIELASLVRVYSCEGLSNLFSSLSWWLLLSSLCIDGKRRLGAFTALRGEHTLVCLRIRLSWTPGRVIVELYVLLWVVLAGWMSERLPQVNIVQLVLNC